MEKPKKLSEFMYAIMKEARRDSLMDLLENGGHFQSEYDEIEAWFTSIGV
jgi:hypothetical protein